MIQNTADAAPTMTESIRNLPIIFLPILPKVTISPIPHIPHTTDRKMIGPAMADRRPINVLNTGVTKSAVMKFDTFSGNALQIKLRTSADAMAMQGRDYSEILRHYYKGTKLCEYKA